MPPESLLALLSRILDYAGLFPPAKLDMATTVRNYAAYLAGEDQWMLGRLIVPVAQLDEFELCAEPHLRQRAADDDPDDDAGPWQICALTAPAGDAALAEDIARIERFNRKYGGHDEDGLAVIDVVELKADSADGVHAAVEALPPWLFPFFELAIDRDPRGLIAVLAEADAGAKVRTGGVTADAYPSPPQLARFIAACAAADVPFKATAGLHHPLRHFSEAVKAEEFGFLNVFIAACMAHAHELGERDVQALLEERAADAFSFSDDAIGWRGRSIDAAGIADLREELAISFGSCSFDEPREDLRALGLL